MRIFRLAQVTVDYPMAGAEVGGLRVENDIPNTGSISASLIDYEVMEGIREIPLSELNLTGKSYSVSETERIRELAEDIRNNGWIKPLIVVIDDKGLYILEGGHRAEALFLLGIGSLPAMVVLDNENIPIS